MLGIPHPDSCGMECMTAGPVFNTSGPAVAFDGHFLLLGEDPLQQAHAGDDT